MEAQTVGLTFNINNMAELLITPLGDIIGPSSSTDNAAVRFDGTTGKLVQNSGVIIDDSNNISGVGTLSSGVITQSGATLDNTYVNVTGDTMTGQLLIDGSSDRQ